MALKSTRRKTTKPKASTKTTPSSKPAARSKPAAQAARTAAKTGKAAVPASPAVGKPAPQNITFSYFAPQAGSVLVAGDFTRWEASPIRLVREQGGVWKTTVALKPGKYEYRLLVDGQWQNDPSCPELQPNEFGSANCVLSVAA